MLAWGQVPTCLSKHWMMASWFVGQIGELRCGDGFRGVAWRRDCLKIVAPSPGSCG